MVRFPFILQPGIPVHEQVAFAARKAIVSGRFQPGDSFPSVRVLSRELKIHANTVQKVIAQLQNEGLLEVHPGIGTVVAQGRRTSRADRLRILQPDIERLTVEAIRLGLPLDGLLELVTATWRELSPAEKGALAK